MLFSSLVKHIINFSLILCFILFNSTVAQIVDCSTSHQSGVFHIYLDELYALSNAFTSDEEIKDLMAKLEFKLSSIAEGVSTEIIVSSPCFVSYCENRQPRDVSAFNTSLVEQMHNNDVILEIWGSLEKEITSAGTNINRANIYYLLVPVWINTNQTPTRPGIQKVVYTSGDSISSASHFDLLADAPQMRIFIEAGLGINYLLNDQFNSARTFICSSLSNMKKYINSKGDSRPNPKEEALIKYLKQVSKDIIVQAKSSSSYEGFLTELDNNTECFASEEGGTP